jgi:uncharacterized membrane protein
MNGRTITILGLLQTGALIFGMIFTALSRKVGADPVFGAGPGVPVPDAYVWAGYFTHYGTFLIVLVFGWIVWAHRSSLGVSRAPSLLVFFSGIILLIALGLIGAFFSIAGATPLERL